MKNKILFILHYPPPVHGASVVGGYIKENKIINNAFECRYINLGTSALIEKIGKNSINKLFRFLHLICQVNKQLVAFEPDLYYMTPSSHGQGFYKDASIIFLVKLSGKKIIYHFHNKGVSTKQNIFFDNILYRFVFRNADVILLSNLLYPDIQKYVPENRVHYCPNGIPSALETRNTERLKTSPKLYPSITPFVTVEILFLSNLIRSKGVLVLIDACSILRDRKVDFHCTIAGSEGDMTKSEIEKEISAKELDSFITGAKGKYGEDKIQALITTDIFVLPTFYHNECMPLVLLEAMQHSLPVVSTFEGAIPDVVEDGTTGFLVPQRDATALAEKLEVLIRDPELRLKMGKAGRIKYEREFTLEIFEGRIMEILEEVVNKK